MLKIVIFALVSVVIAGFLLFSSFLGYRPPLVQYFSTVAVMILFVLAARRMPAGWALMGSRPMRRPLFYGLLAFLGSVACGLVFWVFPNLSSSFLFPTIVFALGLLVFLGIVDVLRRYEWSGANDLHRFGLASGSLALLIVFAFFQEFDKSRKDNPVGMALVSITFLAGLVVLGLRVRRMSRLAAASVWNANKLV